jgi:hypothetical protein
MLAVGFDQILSMVNTAKELYADPRATFCMLTIEEWHTAYWTGEQHKFDYVVCLGLTCHLSDDSTDTLDKFVSRLAGYASKGVIIDFQEKGVYKGQFTSHTREQVSEVFGKMLTKANTLSTAPDSTFCSLLKLI